MKKKAWLLSLLLTCTAEAEIYKCIDDEGNVIYDTTKMKCSGGFAAKAIVLDPAPDRRDPRLAAMVAQHVDESREVISKCSGSACSTEVWASALNGVPRALLTELLGSPESEMRLSGRTTVVYRIRVAGGKNATFTLHVLEDGVTKSYGLEYKDLIGSVDYVVQ